MQKFSKCCLDKVSVQYQFARFNCKVICNIFFTCLLFSSFIVGDIEGDTKLVINAITRDDALPFIYNIISARHGTMYFEGRRLFTFPTRRTNKAMDFHSNLYR